jgi:chitodextrinase
LAATVVSSSQIDLSWSASTDNVGVTGYRVYRDGTLAASPNGTSVSITGLSAGTLYSFTVSAFDAASNVSARSAPLSATTPPPLITPPSTPTGVSASALTPTSLTLSWRPSTASLGVIGYRVYRDGTLVASPSGTSALITGLSAGVPYSFTVSALDVAGTVSALSAPLSVTIRQFLWTAGMEAGNMLEWYLDGGGGEFNGNPGNNPGTGLVPMNVAGSLSQATQEQARSGTWSAKLSIPGSWGAVRLWRWKESMVYRELYYSAWYFVPQLYTMDVRAGGSTNWWQYKSTTPIGQNDPFFLLGWQNTGPGAMRMDMTWWGPATDGPLPGQRGLRRWVSTVDIPIGRWFHIEVRHVCAGDFTGAIQVWQDGVELFHLEGVKTRYPTGDCKWALSNYASNISPSPYYFYADDVAISTTRIGP